MDHVGGSTARFVAVEVQPECPSLTVFGRNVTFTPWRM